jgi:hypothetical protein
MVARSWMTSGEGMMGRSWMNEWELDDGQELDGEQVLDS